MLYKKVLKYSKRSIIIKIIKNRFVSQGEKI